MDIICNEKQTLISRMSAYLLSQCWEQSCAEYVLNVTYRHFLDDKTPGQGSLVVERILSVLSVAFAHFDAAQTMDVRLYAELRLASVCESLTPVRQAQVLSAVRQAAGILAGKKLQRLEKPGRIYPVLSAQAEQSFLAAVVALMSYMIPLLGGTESPLTVSQAAVLAGKNVRLTDLFRDFQENRISEPQLSEKAEAIYTAMLLLLTEELLSLLPDPHVLAAGLAEIADTVNLADELDTLLQDSMEQMLESSAENLPSVPLTLPASGRMVYEELEKQWMNRGPGNESYGDSVTVRMEPEEDETEGEWLPQMPEDES